MGVSTEEVDRGDPEDEKWRAVRDQLPMLVPKKWLETCPKCLLTWIPSFNRAHEGCPACHGAKEDS